MEERRGIRVWGGKRLEGSVAVSGSKNASLPLLAASLLADESVLEGVPQLKDVEVLLQLLSTLGVHVGFSEGGRIHLNARQLVAVEAPYSLLSKMRAAFLVLAPLLARMGEARVALPGGCAIGARPVDLHLKVLQAMGAHIVLENGVVVASAPHGLRGAEYRFEMVSVGATETAIMAAVLAQGVSVFHHVAREPEVVALADALNQAGARIAGQGTDTITVQGVSALAPIHARVIPDRIEAGTFLIAAAMTQGDVTLSQVVPAHIEALLSVLKEVGASVTVEREKVRVVMERRPRAFELLTEIYPGFPTDLQSPMMTLACISEGQSVIREGIFENRMMHAPELLRMGADIRLLGNTALIRGVPSLQGAQVVASDLRAGASLLLAGLAASGTTDVYAVHHIDRGYVFIEERFNRLGGRLKRMHYRD